MAGMRRRPEARGTSTVLNTFEPLTPAPSLARLTVLTVS